MRNVIDVTAATTVDTTFGWTIFQLGWWQMMVVITPCSITVATLYTIKYVQNTLVTGSFYVVQGQDTGNKKRISIAEKLKQKKSTLK